MESRYKDISKNRNLTFIFQNYEIFFTLEKKVPIHMKIYIDFEKCRK